MRSLLRKYLITLLAFYLTTQIVQGLTFSGGLVTLLLSAVMILVINLLVVPILKLTLLPLNIMTFGLFSWVVNVLALYCLTIFIPQIRIISFLFPGYNLGGIYIVPFEVSALICAIVSSLILSIISNLLQWLIK